MSWTEYQAATARTDRTDLPWVTRVANHAMGLAGESGELVDLIKKQVFHGHDLDPGRMRGEIGDVLWYLARLASDFGLTLEECADANIAKLLARYPEGFSTEASVARVDERR